MPMKLTAAHYRPFGNTGLRVPPIMFGTCALGDARHVIPDQTKRGIIAEWFKAVAPPVLIDVGGDDACRKVSLVFLSHSLTRLGIGPDEVAICIRLGGGADFDSAMYSREALVDAWYEDCRLLGDYAPKLVVLERPDEFVVGAETGERGERMEIVREALCALNQLKSESEIVGVGVAVRDIQFAKPPVAASELDWLMLLGGCTVMTHPPAALAVLEELKRRQVPVIAGDVFESGFLVGSDILNSRPFDPNHPDNERLVKWRKSFTALCHGHGITPAHAAIQFALSIPGVAAVGINTSRPERGAENAASACTPVPDSFWWSMKEEALVGEDFPLGM
jgi:D-threo-aldose 1-dehydrogenase